MHTDARAEVLVFGDEALISMFGELDLFSVHVLDDAIRDAGAVSRIVIDLQDVTFLDSAALRRIERAAKTSAVQGRVLRIDRASRIVSRMLDILQLDDLRVR
jgi:anti-anti-sigma factor